MLILPGHPDFYRILATPPPARRGQSFVVRAGSMILEPASDLALNEYLEGGEYDQRLEESGQTDLLTWEESDQLESDVLFLPASLSVR